MRQPPVINPWAEGQGPAPAKWWVDWFSLIFRLLTGLTESGTTAQRPTKNLWVGRMYYDTTLNKPIWVNAITPAVVWKDAAGTTV